MGERGGDKGERTGERGGVKGERTGKRGGEKGGEDRREGWRGGRKEEGVRKDEEKCSEVYTGQHHRLTFRVFG